MPSLWNKKAKEGIKIKKRKDDSLEDTIDIGNSFNVDESKGEKN